jgi:uncharacterized membrane protein
MELPTKPSDSEAEKASNSYVMSLLALMAGLPLPIINLVATLIFFLGNRKSTYFVRWHCTQALLSQTTVLPINSAATIWTLTIIFGNSEVTNAYIAYLITVFVFNVCEFLATLYAAIETRKGKHVEWWFFGALTNLLIPETTSRSIHYNR